ncbi:MAG: hypothetical protein QOF76_977 [Solirubrobacteraceae bacterium]|jgi:hypothetical protein|nr:hypothetical protein [Solirubrobacteraceae bacterium]
MKKTSKAPLTGEAKFLAAKADIAKRNEAARDRLAAARAASVASSVKFRKRIDKEAKAAARAAS